MSFSQEYFFLYIFQYMFKIKHVVAKQDFFITSGTEIA